MEFWNLDYFEYSLGLLMIDRGLASVPKTIEVVKISFPQGLFLISIIQVR